MQDLTFFTDKHNEDASREALDVLNGRLHLFELPRALSTEPTPRQAKINRFFKGSAYNRVPFEHSALGCFVYQYIIRLGFLDGRLCLVYHVLQDFWYRFLAGAKLRELEAAVRDASSSAEIHNEIARFTRQRL